MYLVNKYVWHTFYADGDTIGCGFLLSVHLSISSCTEHMTEQYNIPNIPNIGPIEVRVPHGWHCRHGGET